MDEHSNDPTLKRRDFLRRGVVIAWSVPVVYSLTASAARAQVGSCALTTPATGQNFCSGTCPTITKTCTGDRLNNPRSCSCV